MKSDWLENPIGIYLMSCYAYEELAAPFLADGDFDELGQYIADNWKKLEHRHKHLIDPERCMYTSGITKPYSEWPLIILSATHQITDTPGGTAWQKAWQLAQARQPAPVDGLSDLLGDVDDLI